MKLIKSIFLTLALGAFAGFAQESVDDMPVATIDEDYNVALDTSSPITAFYKADISHLGFTSEEEAETTFKYFLTANLVSTEVNYPENLVVIHIHIESLPADATHEQLNTYLNQLIKPE